MHTFVSVLVAVVEAVLAAVFSKSIGYFSEFVGIPLIISPASAAAAAAEASAASAKRSLRSANAAQQCHNVAFLHSDGPFEGSVAATAGRRVSGKQENNTTQNR